MRKAVLWDVDGVIVDSYEGHLLSWQETWAKRGIDFTEEDFKRVFGMRNAEIVPLYLGKDVSQETIEQIGWEKEDSFRRMVRGKITALPGVMTLFRDLRDNGYMQALVSSTPVENLEMIVDSLKIKPFFKEMISSKDVSRGKPDPQCFLLAAERMGVAPDRCIVMEDAVAGVEAAKRGGMHCVAVTTTNPAEKLKKADIIVSALTDIDIRIMDDLLSDGLKTDDMTQHND